MPRTCLNSHLCGALCAAATLPQAYEVSQPSSTFSVRGSTKGRYAGVNMQLKNVEETLKRHTDQIEVSQARGSASYVLVVMRASTGCSR